MRIAIYGASGMVGSRVAAEALARGHDVTGITRSGGALPAGAQAVTGNAGDPDLAKRIAAGADVVVSAIGPDRAGGDQRAYLTELRNLVETLGGARLIVVGGAGSLLIDGVRLVDQPYFPAEYRGEALVVTEGLEYLRGLDDGTDWTFFSPPPYIQPGERTGAYRKAEDVPAGESISAEDYAVALLDEIEQPEYRGRRFTAAN
jgi:uncharacterized protein